MKKYLILSALALIMATSCNEVDIDLFESPAVEAGAGTLANTAVTVSKLDFSWDAVEGVRQYGYMLKNSNGLTVRTGVTRETSLSFENLESDEEYTLRVEAYGDNGVETKCFEIKARTKAYITLQAPDLNGIEMKVENAQVIVSWPEVAGAEYYDYTLTGPKGVIDSGRIEETSVAFSQLAIGDYTFVVSAGSEVEGYLSSAETTYYFQRTRQIINTYEVEYSSHLFGEATRTMVQYEDGEYVVKDFMGVKGYDLAFVVAANGDVTFTNAYYQVGVYKYFTTGYPSSDEYMTVYEDPDYCYCDEYPTEYIVEFYCYGTSSDGEGGYDTITWKKQ